MADQLPDPKTVRAVTVLVACDFCDERGTVPGGKHREHGERVACPLCEGRGHRPRAVPLSFLRELLDAAGERGGEDHGAERGET